MADDSDGLKYRWLDAVCSEAGPQSSTTRHVLMVLAKHMDPDGGNCYPATRLLAIETALTRQTVMIHLEVAEAAGWIERHERGDGMAWRRHQYTPAIPAGVVSEADHATPKGGKRGSPPSPKGGKSDTERVVSEADLSTPVSTPERKDTSKSVVSDVHHVGPKELWTIWLDHLGGNGRQPTLTDKRRKKLDALLDEQLTTDPDLDPLKLFGAILEAVTASDHHMSERAYQMPESLFRNAERRERWTLAGLEVLEHGTGGMDAPDW